MKLLITTLVIISSVLAAARPAAASTFLGDTVQYQVYSSSSVLFGSGSAVVGAGVEFIVDAAADIGFSDGKIAVDISDSSIVFTGPTTPNTFRYGYETIRIFSLDYSTAAAIGSFTALVSLADPAGLSVTVGPHEVLLRLDNSLWVHGFGDSVRINLSPVPEPSMAAHFLVGACVFGLRALRTRRKTRHSLTSSGAA